MLAEIKAFVLTNAIKLLAVGLVGALVWGSIQTLRLDRAGLKLSAADAKAGALEVQIEAFNTATAAMKTEAAKKEAAAKKTDGAVSRMQASTAKTVAKIQAAPTPTTCEAAIEFIVEGVL